MRTSVPMCGSTASKWNCPAHQARTATSHTAARRSLLLVMFLAAVPVSVHLVGARHPRRTNQAEAQPLSVGFVPDALGQLRVLLLPRRVGRDAGSASQHIRRIVP